MIAAHIHNVRCMWIKMMGARHGIAIPRTVDPRRVRASELLRALSRSSDGIIRLLQLGIAQGGVVPRAAWQNFPTDLVHFLVTPGPLAPARELLGEMLLALKEPAQARNEFEATLKKEPNRFRAVYGAARAASLTGDRAAARRYYAQLLKICERADKPGRSELADADRRTSPDEPEISARVSRRLRRELRKRSQVADAITVRRRSLRPKRS